MKQKAARSKQSSTAHTVESSPALQSAVRGILYEEATSKTVDFIRYAEQSKGSPAFEIRFTDGTFLSIGPVPQIEFLARLVKTNRGNVRAVREYGITG